MATMRKFKPQAIRALRNKLGLTQEQMAERLAVSQSLITHWETGRREPDGPAAILLSQLADEADKKDGKNSA